MQTTHTNKVKAILLTVTMVLSAGLVFAFAPMKPVAAARQALSARINASQTAKKIFSLAPASVRRAIEPATAQPKAAKAAVVTAADMMVAPVTITKDASPASGSAVGPGQVIAYTIQATNGASSDTTVGAGGFVSVIDTAPTGTLFTNATVQQQPQFGSAWSCTILGGGTSIQCVAGDGAGAGVDTFTTQEFVRIRAEATVQPGVANGTVLTNTATYQFNNNGDGTVEGTATSNAVTHVVSPSADLSITKEALTVAGGVFGAAVTAGGNVASGFGIGSVGLGEIEYTLTYRNNGLADAFNVHIRDVIPAGTLLDPTFLPIGVVVTPAAGPGLTCQILPTLNTYQLDCTPNTANGVLPAGANGTIQFSVRVPENILEGAVVKNVATINSEGMGTTPATPDPNGGNNTSGETQNIVRASADLSITKVTSNPTPVAGGAAFSYTLTVTNNGASDAQNVVVTDPLPQGANFISASSNDNSYSCSNSNGTVTCTKAVVIAPAVNAPPIIPPRTGSNTSTILIVAQYAANLASGVRTNTAIVTSGTQDPVPANNSASVQQNIVVDAPLSITKAGPASLCPGQIYTYHITVNNGGSSNALNATISDPLPANTTFLNQTGTGPFQHGCSHNGGTPGTVTCSAVDIPSGLSTLDITVQLSPNAPSGPLANTATITTAGTGTIAVGTSTTTATVAPCATLNVTKIVQSAVTQASNPNQTGPIGPASPNGGTGLTGTAVVPGTRMTYRLNVTNTGPNPVSNIRVLDTLPSNLKLVSATQSSGFSTIFTCQPVGLVGPNGYGGQVQCTAPVMSATAPDNAATIDVVVDIDPATKATITNSVAVNATVSNTTQQSSTTTTLNTPVAPLSDLTLTKTANPTSVFPGTNVLYTLTVRNNGPSVAAMTTVVDTLPAFQTLFSADVSGAPGFTCSGTTVVTCTSAAMAVNETAVIKLTAFVAENAPAGVYTNSATASSMSTDPTPASATATVTVMVKTAPGPGNPFPVRAEASDQKAGSVLFYPIYTSDAASGNVQNTRFSMTNISPTDKVCVHLFAVDGSSCSVSDLFVCLTPNQTATFLASDLDPGSTGYLVAIAVDCDNGLPKAFNCLIGDEFVKFSSGHQSNLSAIAVSSSLVFPVGTDPNIATATLKFDGIAYNRLPRILASDAIMSQVDGNSAMIVIDRIGGNLATTGATIGNITGLLFDDTEISYSFTANIGACQYRKILDNGFPRTLTPFTRVIPNGRTGWMKFWRFEDGALIGSQINFNPNTSASANAFNQGHNLHHLTLTDKAEIIVPVFIPSC